MMSVELDRRRRLASMLNKLDAYQKLQNEAGRVIMAINFRQPGQVLDRLALDHEDVSFEVADEGVFIGREAVEAIVDKVVNRPAIVGEMVDIQLTTPIIEVADDLESARALWWTVGAGSDVSEDGDPQAVWLWGMIAADFVQVAGDWKILHFQYFRFIRCSYEKGWVEDTSMINRPNTAYHPLSSPTTYHDPYSPLRVREGLPAAPRPYKNYDGFGWRLDRDKTR